MLSPLGAISKRDFMCNICDDLKVTINIITPGDLKSVLRQINGFITGNSIELISGNYSYSDFNENLPRPDIIENSYKCIECDTIFSLFCNTYHGSGGSWSLA